MPHFAQLPAIEGRTLLDELNHRIRNEFASIINLVTCKAIWTDNVEAKQELGDVADILHHHVAVHNVLTRPEGHGLVDAADQLRKLGLALSRSKLDRMNIRLTLSTDAAPLESERCWALIMAVYEIVTNAVRHACFDGREGEIKVRLMRSGSWVNCRVTDNGSGLAQIKPGRGLRIIAELAGWLGGRIDHSFGTTHTSFAVDFPLTMREQHANHLIAARRPRTKRRLKSMTPPPSAPVAGARVNWIATQPQI